jgi:hypothetical protein
MSVAEGPALFMGSAERELADEIRKIPRLKTAAG